MPTGLLLETAGNQSRARRHGPGGPAGRRGPGPSSPPGRCSGS